MAGNKPRVVIVGAGIAGLAAAAALHSAAADTFDLRVVEGGDRIGGRIRTAVYGGATVELGATWIHGIGGSPLYKIADQIGALSSETPSENVDLHPPDAVTVSEDGRHVDPSIVCHVSLLFNNLMRSAEGKVQNGAVSGEDDVSLGAYSEDGGRPDLRSGAAVVSGEGDVSLGAFLRRGFKAAAAEDGGARRVVEEAVFRMWENVQRSHTAAEDLSDVDYVAEREYRVYPGDEINIAKGYGSVVQYLVSLIPAGVIRTGLRVSEIRWLPEGGLDRSGTDGPVRLGFGDGTVLFADHVVVTVSLGVLKEGVSRGFFNPGLPGFKEDAIARLGFGVVDKLFAEMEPPGRESFVSPRESPGKESFAKESFVMESEEREFFVMESPTRESFMMESPRRFRTLNMVFYPEGSEMRRGNIPWWMRRSFSVSSVNRDSNVLLSWFVGKEAMELERMTDDEIITGFETTVRSFLTKQSGFRVGSVLRSRWGTDPLFLGSYSFVAVGSSIDDLDSLAKPLPRPGGSGPPLQLLFAGEATHRTHYSTTHGAYLSGLREAERLLEHYNSPGRGTFL